MFFEAKRKYKITKHEILNIKSDRNKYSDTAVPGALCAKMKLKKKAIRNGE